MLPILLYNNMEGGSNSSNGNGSLNFALGFDENVILNSVRSRKKVSELPNCPVCSCTIRAGELDGHLALEVERLQKLSNGATKRKLSSSSGLAVPGSSAESDVVEDSEIDVSGCPGSDVYQRVHSNRLRRLRARRRSTPPPQLPEEGDCPVCNVRMPTSRLQRHALRCLKRTGAEVDDDIPDTSSEEGSIDVENDAPTPGFGAEYRWCGEWRVRASALGAPPPHTLVQRAEHDAALVVDGDEDTELYGPPQFSPSRIAPDTDPPSEEITEETNMEQSTSEPQATSGENASQPLHKPNGLVEASAETRIQALKARIRELENNQNSGSMAKCLICLCAHASPVVSIQCWHVYCEVCWLDSLKAKKICPQCNAITSTEHLRRIYM